MWRVKSEWGATKAGEEPSLKRRKITIELPQELWINIFSLLTLNHLVGCNLVCRSWRQLIDDQALWKLKIQQYPAILERIADFVPLIEQGTFTWKEVLRFVPFNISSLFERILSMRFECHVSEVNDFTMMRPYVQDASYKFWIQHSNVVCYQKRRSSEAQVFLGIEDDTVQITHLAQDGTFVFALCFDGRVIQWNYLQQKLVQVFETAYFKKVPELRELREEIEEQKLGEERALELDDDERIYSTSVTDTYGFAIQGGVVYVKYYNRSVLEAIPYEDVTQASLHKLPRSMGELNHIASIQGHKLYLQGDNAIEAWNLSKKSHMPQETIECPNIVSFLMNDHFQYVATEDKQLFILDPDKSTTRLIYRKDKPIYFVSIFNHHFLFGYQEENDTIFVFNLISNEIVQISDVIDEDSKDIKNTVLTTIIEHCKTSTPKKRDLPVLPSEIWVSIFSTLPAKTLLTTSEVCKSWKDLSQDALLWKPHTLQKYGQGTVLEYEPLVEKGDLQWKDIYFFSPTQLHSFFNQISKSRCDYNEFKGLEFSFAMGCPFVQNGKWQFFIKSTAVEMKKRRGNESYILGSDQLLTHLALEGNFLFALCINGQILQWDYETRNLVHRIDTTYVQQDCFSDLRKKIVKGAKKDDDEESMHEVSIARSTGFVVKEGTIFIKYHEECFLEMISYENPADKKCFTIDESLVNFGGLIQKENLLFFRDNKEIRILNLLNEKIQFTTTHRNISAMMVEGNFLYIANCNIYYKAELVIVNLETRKEQVVHIFNVNPIQGMSIYKGGLLLCFQTPVTPKISIHEIHTGKVIYTLEDVVDNETNDIKEEVLTKIIHCCKSWEEQKSSLQS